MQLSFASFKTFFGILFPFYFLNYENMILHLQETWNIQSKVIYNYTVYYNYFLK